MIKDIADIQINIIDSKKLVQDFNFYIKEEEVNQIQFKEKKHLTIKEFFMLFIKEGNYKGYMLSAFVLLLSTFIVRQKIYYYIVISILLVLAVVCKALPKLKQVKRG